MKKVMFLLVLSIAIFSLLRLDLSAQPCPPGFSGPATVTVEVCTGCFIQATWCCDTIATPFGDKPAIHFSDLLIIGNCDFCLEWMTTPSGWAVPSIPWKSLIGAVMTSGELCFTGIPSIPPCDPAPPTEYNIVVTNGGCYTRIETLEGKWYVPCESDVLALCYEYYRICWEFVNGQWKIKIEGLGKQPAFNCIEPNCYPLCN